MFACTCPVDVVNLLGFGDSQSEAPLGKQTESLFVTGPPGTTVPWGGPHDPVGAGLT